MTVRKLMLIALLAAVSAQAQVRPTTKAVTVNPTNFNLLFPTAEQFGRSNGFLRFISSDGTVSIARSGTTARLHVDIPDVSEFLTQEDADLLYQPIGGEGGFLTRDTADGLYQPLGDYALASSLLDYLTADAAALAYVPTGRTITVNGDVYSLASDVSIDIQTGNPFDQSLNTTDETHFATVSAGVSNLAFLGSRQADQARLHLGGTWPAEISEGEEYTSIVRGNIGMYDPGAMAMHEFEFGEANTLMWYGTALPLIKFELMDPDDNTWRALWMGEVDFSLVTGNVADNLGLVEFLGAYLTVEAAEDLLDDKVDATTTLTINGVSYDLSADRSWDTGNGFPLTENVSGAGKTLSDLGGLQATNAYISNLTARTISGGSANLQSISVGSLSADASEVVVSGDFTVLGTVYQTTVINVSTVVVMGVTTNYRTETVYSTAVVYQVTVTYTNVVTTNNVTTYVQVGGSIDATNGVYVYLPTNTTINGSPVLTNEAAFVAWLGSAGAGSTNVVLADGSLLDVSTLFAGLITQETVDDSIDQALLPFTLGSVTCVNIVVTAENSTVSLSTSNRAYRVRVVPPGTITNWAVAGVSTTALEACAVVLEPGAATDFSWKGLRTNVAPAAAHSTNVYFIWRGPGSGYWTVD